jgi:nitroimidazol reductase NimA-like FMN-containing flavoprotein (pyridoxamine 5'-phosphate oxidase superfamily)
MPAIHELDHAECQALLRRGSFGRVVLATPKGVEILPVNYAVHDDTIVMRTSSLSLLTRHGDGADLVFEVDEVDPAYWSGWSVVARGRGVLVRSANDVPLARRVRPWPDGDHSWELRLTWTELTGRRVGGAH